MGPYRQEDLVAGAIFLHGLLVPRHSAHAPGEPARNRYPDLVDPAGKQHRTFTTNFWRRTLGPEGRCTAMTRMLAQQVEFGARPVHSGCGLALVRPGVPQSADRAAGE